MKRFFVVFLILLLAISANLKAQVADSPLSLEHRIFGTWKMDLSVLPEEIPASINPSYSLTFHCEDLGVPGTPSKPNKCYFQGEVYIEQYSSLVNITCDWYIENDLLCWKAVDASLHCNVLEDPNLNEFVRMLLIEKTERATEEIKEEMLLLKFKVQFKDDNNLVLKPKYYGVRENGEIKLVDEEAEQAEYVKQYIEMYGKEPDTQQQELKYTRQMVLSSTQQGLDVILSCKNENYTMNFDEEAFAEIHRWNSKTGNVMVGGVDNPEEPGTYLYYVDNEGARSNLHKVIVLNPINLTLKCFESESPEDKKIVTKILPSGGFRYCYTDRYKLLEDGGCRILLYDKVQFYVTSDGVDVTDDVELYDNNIRITPEHRFTTPGIHAIIAKYGNGFSEIVKVEVMEPVTFAVSPEKIHLGERPKFSVKQNGKTVSKWGICYADIDEFVHNPLGPVPSIGTYTYYAVVDEKVASNKDQIVVVEPEKLIPSTNLHYSNKLGRYLTQTNTSFKFKATQSGKDVTSDSEFYDTEGKAHNANYKYKKAGLYTHYATKGISVSNNVNIEARGELKLTCNKERFEEYGTVTLTATQDLKDVTSSSEFYHMSGATGWAWVLLDSNADYKPHEGENCYKAVRDEIFESEWVRVIIHKNKNIIPGALMLTADKKYITVGESVNFTVSEGGKPINAKIYHRNKVVDNPFVATLPGVYDFVASKSSRYSNYVSVVVGPKDQPQPPAPTPQPADSIPEPIKRRPTATNYEWQGTYEVTTSHQLVYNQDNTVDYIKKNDTLNVVIAFDQNINKYRVYGLCKNSPESDIIAHISENGEMYLVGSSFKSSAIWAFVMEGSADTSNSGYRYYTKPSFALPYVFTMDAEGNIKHTPTEVTEGDKKLKFVAVSIFDVNHDNSQLRHRGSSEQPTYPAGQLTFKRISNTFSIPKQEQGSLGKSSHTTCELQSNSNFLSIFAPRN